MVPNKEALLASVEIPSHKSNQNISKLSFAAQQVPGFQVSGWGSAFGRVPEIEIEESRQSGIGWNCIIKQAEILRNMSFTFICSSAMQCNAVQIKVVKDPLGPRSTSKPH
jgi:hypothetical protein